MLLEGLLSLNRIEDGKLSLLATRLAQSVVSGSEETPFTDEELSKLEISLEMTRPEVQLAVRGIVDLICESAYDLVTQNVLESKLKSVGLEPSKVATLVIVWGKTGQAVSEALKRKSVLPQVSHVAYSLSVQAGSDIAASEKVVKGHLQLGLNSAHEPQNLDLEFTHEELYGLHSQLNRIQSQLDAIADK